MAKQAKAAELRLMNPDELGRRATELRESLFNLRLAVRTGEEAETSKINAARRELARILTLDRERQLGIVRKAPAPQAEAKAAEAAPEKKEEPKKAARPKKAATKKAESKKAESK